jgi:hypothetical protein
LAQQKQEEQAITRVAVSDTLQELIDKANSSFRDGKQYVLLAYKQALAEGYTPDGAKKMLLREIKVFGKSTIYAALPDEAKRTYISSSSVEEENLQKLQHFQALENLFFMVTIPEWGNVTPLEKEFQLSPKWARDLRKQMIVTGRIVFRAKREGSTAFDTKYVFMPVTN